MILFLYGADTYRSRQKLKEIINRYKKVHKSGLSLRRFNEEGFRFEDFQNEIETASMFKEKKLLLLINVFANQEFKDRFLKNKKKILHSDDTIVVYQAGGVNKKELFVKFLLNNSKSQEFKPLEGRGLRNWIRKEFLHYHLEISGPALERLIESVGSDSWQMANEIKKLSLYKMGQNRDISANEGGEIRLEDVNILVVPKIENDIFKTVDAVAARNKKTALRLLKSHLKKGSPPLYLLSMISLQFRNLLIIKDLMERNISPYGSSGLHPYVIRKSLFISGRFSLAELKRIYLSLFQLDIAVKTGKMDAETAIDLFIAGI